MLLYLLYTNVIILFSTHCGKCYRLFACYGPTTGPDALVELLVCVSNVGNYLLAYSNTRVNKQYNKYVNTYTK